MAVFPGPGGIAMAGAIKGMGYASAGLVAGQVIGSFEDGGIVGGSSYTGDKLLSLIHI